jgi:hypothetical protein
MQNECTLTPAERQRTLDSAILGLLVSLDDHRPWSELEIASEVGENVTDSLNRLHGAGAAAVWRGRVAVAKCVGGRVRSGDMFALGPAPCFWLSRAALPAPRDSGGGWGQVIDHPPLSLRFDGGGQ